MNVLPKASPRTRDLPQSLEELDRRIDALGPRLSLAPDRRRATALTTLVQRAAPKPLREPLSRSLLALGSAQVDAFPDNIFWDFDALAFSLVRQAQRCTEPANCLDVLGTKVAILQSLFGRHTTIHFRYVHDFMYGFDWSKWVRKDVDARRAVQPFDEAFLDYSVARGRELLALIEADDEKYPKLPSGAPRNPFGFSREPDQERVLFEALAAKDLIPVRAWEELPEAHFDRDYQALRRELAESL